MTFDEYVETILYFIAVETLYTGNAPALDHIRGIVSSLEPDSGAFDLAIALLELQDIDVIDGRIYWQDDTTRAIYEYEVTVHSDRLYHYRNFDIVSSLS